jgi:hypothetical protein
VLVDTNRDWGSEIVLLKTHPLAVSTVLKTGKGGIGAMDRNQKLIAIANLPIRYSC